MAANPDGLLTTAVLEVAVALRWCDPALSAALGEHALRTAGDASGERAARLAVIEAVGLLEQRGEVVSRLMPLLRDADQDGWAEGVAAVRAELALVSTGWDDTEVAEALVAPVDIAAMPSAVAARTILARTWCRAVRGDVAGADTEARQAPTSTDATTGHRASGATALLEAPGSSSLLELDLMRARAFARRRGGDPTGAFALLKRGRDAASPELDGARRTTEAAVDQVDVLLELGRVADARVIADDVLAGAADSPSVLLMSRLRCVVARRIHLPNGELDLAESLARTVENDLGPRSHDAGLASAIAILAAVAESRGRLDQALSAQRRAAEIDARAREAAAGARRLLVQAACGVFGPLPGTEASPVPALAVRSDAATDRPAGEARVTALATALASSMTGASPGGRTAVGDTATLSADTDEPWSGSAGSGSAGSGSAVRATAGSVPEAGADGTRSLDGARRTRHRAADDEEAPVHFTAASSVDDDGPRRSRHRRVEDTADVAAVAAESTNGSVERNGNQFLLGSGLDPGARGSADVRESTEGIGSEHSLGRNGHVRPAGETAIESTLPVDQGEVGPPRSASAPLEPALLGPARSDAARHDDARPDDARPDDARSDRAPSGVRRRDPDLPDSPSSGSVPGSVALDLAGEHPSETRRPADDRWPADASNGFTERPTDALDPVASVPGDRSGTTGPGQAAYDAELALTRAGLLAEYATADPLLDRGDRNRGERLGSLLADAMDAFRHGDDHSDDHGSGRGDERDQAHGGPNGHGPTGGLEQNGVDPTGGYRPRPGPVSGSGTPAPDRRPVSR